AATAPASALPPPAARSSRPRCTRRPPAAPCGASSRGAGDGSRTLPGGRRRVNMPESRIRRNWFPERNMLASAWSNTGGRSMWLRLRQIALVARDLGRAERELTEVLGVRVCYRDPGVGHFGLENILLPIGNQILEVVAPVRPDTAAGRYLERRGGDGGYMVITQCDDHEPRRRRVAELGIRIVNQFETEHFRNMQLHPKDTGGSFFEIDEQRGPDAHRPDGPWEPAGPDWQAGRALERVAGITAAEIQCDDPERVARRWGEIAELDARPANGH